MKSMLISVRFHDGRYHGEGDGFSERDSWPPSPARLFQALVAGAAHGGTVGADDQVALCWLESLQPPRIAAPASRRGAGLTLFVPNNDLDAEGGDPANVAQIRVGKSWRPRFFEASVPIIYVWNFDPPEANAKRACAIAERLYQLGRGVDMAAASGEIMDGEEAETILCNWPGELWQPGGAGGVSIPAPGSLSSLIRRHQHQHGRLQRDAKGKTSFTQPPKAWFRHIGYDAKPRRLHYDLRHDGSFVPQALESAAAVVTCIRDAAARRLQEALPSESRVIERLIVGRGTRAQDLVQRVRILPVPSIGMEHTDPSIRRITVEVPPQCPIRWRDLAWAFAGLTPFGSATAERFPERLVSTNDASMVSRYARPARVFRSVTAVALSHARRRSVKSSESRLEDERRARAAVVNALRHADVRAKPTSIHVQREPLHRRGARAEAFAHGSRFAPVAMWHVVLEFPTELEGPLVIGDGRFCGLGLMEPVTERCDVIGLELGGGDCVARSDMPVLLHSLRRALMACARDDHDRVPRLFSGHEADGSPDRSEHHAHIYVAADSGIGPRRKWITRLLVVAPWAADQASKGHVHEQHRFETVVYKLCDLRAGRVGRFQIRAVPVVEGDPVIGPATTWESVTAYRATRNLKKKDDAYAAVTEDVRLECHRRGLAVPKRVEVVRVSAGPRGGQLTAFLRLHFSTAVRGPILLGRDSHSGGGLFHGLLRHSSGSVSQREGMARPSSGQDAWEDLTDTMDQLGREATSRGLTDAQLDALLADES